MRPATSQELKGWNELLTQNPDGGNILQSKAFGESKSKHGWTDRYFIFGGAPVLILERMIPRLGRLWYVPNGPGVTEKLGLLAFADEVRRLPEKPFLVKIDPEIPKGAVAPKDLKTAGYVMAPRDLQYNVNTAIVDLIPSEDEILASFRQKTRYNIRLAAKKGVEVKAVPTDAKHINLMYDLFTAMTERAGVYLRSKQYFSDFWKQHSEQGIGQLFLAEYEDQVLAGAYVTFLGNKGLYKDGGSLREHTDVQAPYALQWEVMRWLKAKGITEYDLHGTPPPDQIDNRNHPLAGLARFKTGFQCEITEYFGTYDLVLDPKRYALWNRIGERVAVAYEYRVKKRLFY